MTKNKNRLGPNGKQTKISLKIRRDIRNGIYAPGEKLPPRTELEQEYASSTVTVQKAFDKLKEDGYIYSDGPKGTFVAKNPPCFSNYAIVFPHHLKEYDEKVSFYGELKELSQSIKKSDCYFTIYTGLNGHVDELDYVRLCDDVKADRLAGIIFATDPSLIQETPLFKKIINNKYLPKVAFMGRPVYPEIPTIKQVDQITKIFDFLEKNKVERLAVITYQQDVVDHNHFSTYHEEEIFRLAKARNIDLPKYNFQVRHPALAVRTRDLSHLLLKGEAKDRPQALWIANDSLVEGATKGIVDAGLKVPEDLIVISHCNFPKKSKSFVNTYWYGLDVNDFINLALDILNRQTRGKAVQSIYVLENKYYL